MSALLLLDYFGSYMNNTVQFSDKKFNFNASLKKETVIFLYIVFRFSIRCLGTVQAR